MTRTILAAALAALLPAAALAAGSPTGPQAGRETPPATGQAGAQAPLPVDDVEQLNDRAQMLEGRKVTVSGEIEERRGPSSFVLESGGLFDDEIAVLVPPKAGIEPRLLEEDAEVSVTGTLRRVSVVEIERDYGWDLDPEIEAELEGTRSFLVAERIAPKPE